ncbi:hypothetical protein J6590_036033, partial [Homalodisca vitripennis]
RLDEEKFLLPRPLHAEVLLVDVPGGFLLDGLDLRQEAAVEDKDRSSPQSQLLFSLPQLPLSFIALQKYLAVSGIVNTTSI